MEIGATPAMAQDWSSRVPQLFKRHAVAAVLMVLVTICSNAAAQNTGSFERSLSVNGAIELDVTTGSGPIKISAGPSGQVKILGNIEVHRTFGRQSVAADIVRQFEAEPPVELLGNRLRVGAIHNEYRRGVTISYEIEVPSNSAVMSRTGSGSQIVTGLAGPVEVSAGSGSITIVDLEGDVAARTGSGSIRADGINGAFIARTGSGSVKLEQSGPGDVEVATGSGSSQITGVNGALRVRAGSGSITVDGEQNGRWDLQTGSGSIRIRVPEDAAFELDAHSGSGEIDINHPIMVQGRVANGTLRGPVRGGGDLLQARTGSGHIRIQ